MDNLRQPMNSRKNIAERIFNNIDPLLASRVEKFVNGTSFRTLITIGMGRIESIESVGTLYSYAGASVLMVPVSDAKVGMFHVSGPWVKCGEFKDPKTVVNHALGIFNDPIDVVKHVRNVMGNEVRWRLVGGSLTAPRLINVVKDALEQASYMDVVDCSFREKIPATNTRVWVDISGKLIIEQRYNNGLPIHEAVFDLDTGNPIYAIKLTE